MVIKLIGFIKLLGLIIIDFLGVQNK